MLSGAILRYRTSQNFAPIEAAMFPRSRLETLLSFAFATPGVPACCGLSASVRLPIMSDGLSVVASPKRVRRGVGECWQSTWQKAQKTRGHWIVSCLSYLCLPGTDRRLCIPDLQASRHWDSDV